MDLINPNGPTREEALRAQMKVAKANLASDIAKSLVSELPYIQSEWDEDGKITSPGRHFTAEEVANFSIAVADKICDTFFLMPEGGKQVS